MPALASSSGISRNRDGSFSSHLDSSEEAIVRRLTESKVDDEVEGEIGVFSAEKYFNGRIDDDIITPRRVTTLLGSSRRRQQQCKSRTPSLKSESSWNSRSQFLKGSFRNNSCRGNSSKKGLLYGLTCRCYCSDKDSVDVKEEAIGEISFRGDQNSDRNLISGKASPETASRDLDTLKKKKEVCFSFPTTPGTVLSGIHEPNSMLTQKSIDFFGFPVNLKGKEPDNESDGSSDLFEIESVTGRVTPFLASQASGVPSGCVTPLYAPSEASIDWSVVTASIADFSVVSDQERLGRAHSPRKASTVTERPWRRSGSFLGCKTGESIRVANDATTNRAKEYEPKPEVGTPKLRNSDSFPRPTVRVQAHRKLTGLDARYNQHHLVSNLSRPHLFSPPDRHLSKISILDLHR